MLETCFALGLQLHEESLLSFLFGQVIKIQLKKQHGKGCNPSTWVVYKGDAQGKRNKNKF